jgi:hypothetical protein
MGWIPGWSGKTTVLWSLSRALETVPFGENTLQDKAFQMGGNKNCQIIGIGEEVDPEVIRHLDPQYPPLSLY